MDVEKSIQNRATYLKREGGGLGAKAVVLTDGNVKGQLFFAFYRSIVERSR